MGEASPIARSRPSGAPTCCCRPSPSSFDHPDVAASLVTTMGEALPVACSRPSDAPCVLLPSFSFLVRSPRRRGVPRRHHGRGACSCVLASVRRSCVLLPSFSFLLRPPDVAASHVITIGEALPVARSSFSFLHRPP